MMNKRAVLLVSLIAGLASGSVFAQSTNAVRKAPVVRTPARELHGKIGDPAPPLTVQEWVKGRPVKIEPGTNIYAIVFCTLSHANDFALTNLDALQKRYADKGLITVIVSEESPKEVTDFVRARGGDINFTVAVDDLASRTLNTYSRIFNWHVTPQAYVISKDAKVLWYGHPLREGMGEVVDQVLSGQYNMERTHRMMQANELMDMYMALARQGDPRANRIGQAIIRFQTNDAPALCDFAYQIAADNYIENRDVALANAALERAEQITNTNATDIAVDRSILLFRTGKQEEGLALAKKTLAQAQTDDDKSELNICIHAMEDRIAQDKIANASTATNAPAATNAPVKQP